MPGLSHALDIARRAMTAQQSVLSVLSHNVANVNTEGYTRQVARLVSEPPSVSLTEAFGNGVRVDGVDRKRDVVLDQELRRNLADLGLWDERAARLETLESIVNEPSDSSLSAALDEFWNSWSALSSDPDDQTRRAVVREAGRVLVYRAHTMNDRLQRTGQDIDREIATRVDEFNLLLGDLRNLNTLIKQAMLQGNNANDLRDRRDLLQDQLNELAEVTTGETEDGILTVRLDHTVILDETQFQPLEARIVQDAAGRQRSHVVFSDGDEPEVSAGRIGGLVGLRGETLPELLGELDALMGSLIEEVNGLHEAGPSGVGFFYGSGAADIAVAAPIEDSLSAINASTSGLPGDNDIALAIAQLRDTRAMESGTLSLNDYWSNVVGGIGVDSREASFQRESLTVTTDALTQSRDSTSGVSLDEELTTLLATQQAYQAAVRIFQATEEMMDVLMAI